MTILHPNIFYFILDGSWSKINSLEFWSKGNTATTNNNNTVYKTIYSPSPTSYIEPKSAACTGFTTTGANAFTASQFNVNGSFNKGWNLYCQPNFSGGTVFFSALGLRDAYSGRVNNSTAGCIALNFNKGDYWAAIPSSTSGNGRGLGFDPSGVYPQNTNIISYGFSARSVLE